MIKLWRFTLLRFGFCFEFALVGQQVHKRTGIRSKSTLSLVRWGSRNAELFKQRLLRIDDTSSLGDLIRKQR